MSVRSRLRGAGAGELWAGQIEQSGAECVVRRVRLAPDPVLRSAALAAAELTAELSHPHLVPVIAVLPTSDGLALITEPVGGAISLARLLSARGTLDPGEVVTVGLPIAQALGAAHALGIVHGRLGPEDVLLEPTGRPVLVGLGVAALADATRAAEKFPLAAAGDVHDLATILLESMREATGPEAAAVAVAVATAMVDDAQRRPSADDLAAVLARSATPLPVRLDLPEPEGSGAGFGAGGATVHDLPGRPPQGDARPRLLSGARLDPPVGGAGQGGGGDFDSDAGDSERRSRSTTGATAPLAGELLDSLPALPRRSTSPRRGSRPSGRGQPAASAAGAAATIDRERPGGDSRDAQARPAPPAAGPARREGRSGGNRRSHHDGGRRGGWLLPTTAGVGLFVAVVAAVLLLTSPSDDGGPERGAPSGSAATNPAVSGGAGAASGAARQPTASPVAGRSAEQVWRGVLGELNTARSRAFERGEEALLTGSDAPGSQAHNDDLALIRAIVSRGAHSSPLRTEILALQVRSSSSEQTVLRVTDRLGAYDFLDAGGEVVSHQNAKNPTERDLVLVHLAAGWRVSQSFTVTG
ncbi:serine/threonine protein kinase [Frankia sp. Ag45/Mut15]|uniref:Serine/threonine protein kinase n=1 Tax=Frankia umida TaxID=573489 RepID=A0ABT0K1V9_9ACTN|nr:serine/threonine protein kinase [Frankia umida]MCK9877778.1 serine/threonine protein kinase [Frankia umida]